MLTLQVVTFRLPGMKLGDVPDIKVSDFRAWSALSRAGKVFRDFRTSSTSRIMLYLGCGGLSLAVPFNNAVTVGC